MSSETFDGESTDTRPGALRIRPVGESRACLIMMTGAFPGETYVLAPNAELSIGRAPGCEIRIRTGDVSRAHAKIKASASGKVEMIDLGSTNGTFINGKRQLFRVLREGDKIQFGEHTVFRFCFHDEVDEEFQSRLLGEPFLDRVTNTMTRERLLRALNAAHRDAMAGQSDLSVFVMTIDGFDLMETLLGYAVRDYFLRELSWVIRKVVAGEGTLYRVGPQSFATVLPGVNLEAAVEVATRVRRTVAMTRFTHKGDEMVFSLGIGVAAMMADSPDSGASLLSLAENRCTEAEAAGGDRIQSAG